MATRLLLEELVARHNRGSSLPVRIESVGGVDAAKRVVAGEAFDLVILGSEAIDKLISSGHALEGSKVDLVRSGVAVAVREGTAKPDISTVKALRETLLAAPSISYSTGPSGLALARLFQDLGLGKTLESRIIQPPPGIPVGSLVARGEVALGFQQLSELMHLEGITVLGALPAEIQIITTFSGALCPATKNAEAARAFLAFLASPETAEAKVRQGMEPA